ncbi:MAG: hypothetical protein FJW69_06160 [Actinobacteria bacterium]|nr:hypothetical protein [Actinomycetota bacterium]MBM3712532.1 hypothetical protein [Actinomycetota bacterium]
MFNFKRKKILFFAVVYVFLFILVLTLTSCDVIKEFLLKKVSLAESAFISPENDDKDNNKGVVAEESSKDTSAEVDIKSTESEEPNDNIINYRVAYFDVGISPDSNHFEHRVANIYSVNSDGSGKKLIYSDIEQDYDMGFIYNTSPDGKKILGMLTEEGRGLYSALCVIDVLDGSLKKLVEFDYTDTEEEPVSMLGIFGSPVWSNDSLYIAYELVLNPQENPFSGNFRDAGIYITNVNTAESYEVEIEAGGVSARSTTFLTPVAFSPDGDEIFTVSHIYNEIIEEGEVVGFYAQNDTLYSIGLDGGIPVKIIGIEDFQGIGPEIITSFDNFKIIKNENRLLFQVLGDFEEDGDLWTCSFNGSDLAKITGDGQLREQQPCVFEPASAAGKIAYIGVLRYGTIGYQASSGSVFTANTDGTGVKQLTDYQFGAAKPVFSPDGKFLAFLFSKFDENYDYITENIVRIHNFLDGSINEVRADGFIFDIAGWVISD